jgi:hypothetical protein
MSSLAASDAAFANDFGLAWRRRPLYGPFGKVDPLTCCVATAVFLTTTSRSALGTDVDMGSARSGEWPLTSVVLKLAEQLAQRVQHRALVGDDAHCVAFASVPHRKRSGNDSLLLHCSGDDGDSYLLRWLSGVLEYTDVAATAGSGRKCGTRSYCDRCELSSPVLIGAPCALTLRERRRRASQIATAIATASASAPPITPPTIAGTPDEGAGTTPPDIDEADESSVDDVVVPEVEFVEGGSVSL